MGELLHSATSEELGDLLRDAGPTVERLFRRLRIPEADRDDLVQESLIAYLQRSEEVQNPAAWLVGAVRYRSLMFLRRQRRSLLEAVDDSLLEQLAGPIDSTIERQDLRRDLSSMISRLSERCRRLLRLRYGLDCELPETARAMGYRPSGIRQIANRCLAALTREMVSDDAGACTAKGSLP